MVSINSIETKDLDAGIYFHTIIGEDNIHERSGKTILSH